MVMRRILGDSERVLPLSREVKLCARQMLPYAPCKSDGDIMGATLQLMEVLEMA